jgi:hypothetical protein
MAPPSQELEPPANPERFTPMMLRPDQQDIAVGIDKLVERIKEATKAAAEADQGKR